MSTFVLIGQRWCSNSAIWIRVFEPTLHSPLKLHKASRFAADVAVPFAECQGIADALGLSQAGRGNWSSGTQ